MIEINKNVLLVEGAKNGAIYDFNKENVFSINDIALDIIKRCVISQNAPSNKTEEDYIKLLLTENLISNSFTPKEFDFNSLLDDKPILEQALLEVTNNCNLKCLHCYEGTDSHQKTNDELSLNEWKSLLKDLNYLGCKNIQITGGEPCVSPFIAALLEYAASLNFQSITLSTNATIFPNNLINIIKKNNIKIKFSIYGSNSSIHDKITQIPGSFDKLILNIRKLLSNNIIIKPSIIIMKENQDDFENIKSLLLSLGIKDYKFDVIRNVYNGNQHLHQPEFRIKKTIYKTSPNFKTTKHSFLNAINHNTCLCGKIAISPQGKVFPCVFMRNIILGDIKHSSIIDIVKNKTNKIWGLSYNEINSCKDCEFRYACKDCRALAYSVAGNLYDKNPRCLYNPYTGIWDKQEK